MKALVIYDSAYGNTEKIAKVINETISQFASTKLLPATKVAAADLSEIDTLVVGAPTQGGRPTKPVQQLIGELRSGSLKGVKVAAYDTRFAAQKQKLGLRMLMKTIGYAAPKIMRALKAKGGQQANELGAFIVKDKEGPLDEGELERAASWAKQLQ